jgi:hypothetical protein
MDILNMDILNMENFVSEGSEKEKENGRTYY